MLSTKTYEISVPIHLMGKNLGVKKLNSGRTHQRTNLVYIQEMDIRVKYSELIRQLIVKKQNVNEAGHDCSVTKWWKVRNDLIKYIYSR